jgi:GNAT superfamily N-acetyltransferase
MLTIRNATIADAALLDRMVRELAEFERAPDLVHTDQASVARDGFGADPLFRALIAEWDGRPAAYALFFNYYSTWRGAGFYLEDLYVRPDFRGRGIGTALLARVAQIANDEDRVFLRWQVLDWNRPAIDMYKALDAEFLDGWLTFSLSGGGLRKLAEKTSAGKSPSEKRF